MTYNKMYKSHECRCGMRHVACGMKR